MSEEEIDSGTVGRSIGLAMVPGKHIVKMEIRKKVFFFQFSICLAYKFLAILGKFGFKNLFKTIELFNYLVKIEVILNR